MIDTKPVHNASLNQKLNALRQEIGHTPLLAFPELTENKNLQIYGKQEWKQLSGSVKARAAYAIFRNAIEKGLWVPGKTLLDATSGNTGIAYAWIGRKLGIPVTLCLPENASAERKEILRSMGVHLILTSRFEGTDGAQELAREMAENAPHLYYYADQYKNENNWKAHFEGTAPEILEALPSVTHFVTGLGTTGSFVGTARKLKQAKPSVRLISLEPDNPLHGLEGWKHLETAVVPEIYDPTIADDHLVISTDAAYDMIREVKEKKGLVLSPSSAANLVGVRQVASQLDNAVIVTLLPDNGDKYGEVLRKILK